MKRKSIQVYTRHRWILCLMDSLQFLIWFTIIALAFSAEIGWRGSVFACMAFISAWFISYRGSAFNLHYYMYVLKVGFWTLVITTGYFLFVDQLKTIPLIWGSMVLWLGTATLLRFFLAQDRAFAKLLVVDSARNLLPTSRKVEYHILDTPHFENFAAYDALVIEQSEEYDNAWRALIAHAQMVGLPILTCAQLKEILTGKMSLKALKTNLIKNSFNISWIYALCKRVGDTLVILLLLPILLPLSVIVGLAILLTMGWPVIFWQARVGKAGKIFNVYKFRTMKKGSHKVQQETTENDNRITPLGKFLRKVRLDEIPQFWNVLKGDMSIIGPRPEWDYTAEEFSRAIPIYHIRHLVKPGITGWAQVNQGHATGIDGNYEKLQYDIYYVKHFSFWLDVKIILKTIQVVLTGHGAK